VSNAYVKAFTMLQHVYALRLMAHSQIAEIRADCKNQANFPTGLHNTLGFPLCVNLLLVLQQTGKEKHQGIGY
jgi:hypothetical protein